MNILVLKLVLMILFEVLKMSTGCSAIRLLHIMDETLHKFTTCNMCI